MDSNIRIAHSELKWYIFFLSLSWFLIYSNQINGFTNDKQIFMKERNLIFNNKKKTQEAPSHLISSLLSQRAIKQKYNYHFVLFEMIQSSFSPDILLFIFHWHQLNLITIDWATSRERKNGWKRNQLSTTSIYYYFIFYIERTFLFRENIFLI